jgi:hypothetical protein
MTSIITAEKTSLDHFKDGVDNLLNQRTYFMAKIFPTLKEGVDYHVIKGRKSLSKSGAESLCSIFSLVASFSKDIETMDSFKGVDGLCAYKCVLRSRSGEFAGEGRGASLLKNNNGDPNKAIKMCQKSAFVDAVIRSTGLSHIFTQDLPDLPPEMVSPTPKSPTPKPTNESAPIPSNFWGLTDEDDFGNSYGSEMNMEQENIDREDEEIRQKHSEKEWRPATEKQRAFLTSLILDRCAEPTERERFLNEMESADIGEASELISSFLMAPRY